MTNSIQTRITADEFLAMPETGGIVELIDGEIVISFGDDDVKSPKSPHQKCVVALITYISRKVNSGELLVAPMAIKFDDENVLEPDVFWLQGENSLCKLGEDEYYYGAPDLAIEVLSPSTERRDRGVKFQLYEKHGVREYWIVDPDGKFIEMYARDGEFFRHRGLFAPNEMFASDILGGVEIEVSAIF